MEKLLSDDDALKLVELIKKGSDKAGALIIQGAVNACMKGTMRAINRLKVIKKL